MNLKESLDLIAAGIIMYLGLRWSGLLELIMKFVSKDDK